MVDKLMRVVKKMYKPGGAPKKAGMHRPEGAGNFENMDDYNFVDSINVNSGTVQHTPTNEKDVTNKEYVDSLIRGSVELFLTNNASDIGTYLDMETDVVTAAEETITKTITAGSTTLIASFASELNDVEIDAITALEQGIYSSHLHVSATKSTGMTIYFEFYKRVAGGTETLLGTSHDSEILTLTKDEYTLHSSIVSEVSWTAGDRVVVKIYGRNTGGANKDISLFVESDTLSRVEFPAFIPPTFVGPHTIASHSDTTGTGAELDTLTDGSETALHSHAGGGGDVTAGANLTDETLVQGDGGAKGVKTSTATVAQIEANTAKNTNVTTNLSLGAVNATTMIVASSDGTDATLIEADTTDAGLLGSDKWDEIVANTSDRHASGSDDQQSSDFTHDDLISGTIADHDTGATGTELDTLTDNSMSDALHRHSELSASDGTPDASLKVGANGFVTIGASGSIIETRMHGSDAGEYMKFYVTNDNEGQIESTGKFVLVPTTSVVAISTNNPQMLIQYQGGSFNTMNLYHDDSDGEISTSAGDLILNPAGNVNCKNGFSGTFPDNNGATVTVLNGIITGVA